jgi:ribonuclease Z
MLDLNGLKLTGASASGVGTCLVAQNYGVAVDMGFCTPAARSCRTVLLTHAHVDHVAAAVVHAATRDMLSMEPSRFVMPQEMLEPFREMLQAFGRLQNEEFRYELVALPPGESLHLKKGLRVVPFRSCHRLPSLGYLLYESRSKLKAQFVGLPGEEVGRLRKSGVEVTDTAETPVLAFTGDTTPEALLHPDLMNVKVLVTECTFMGKDVSVEYARKMGHTHLDELAPHLERLGCETFVLTHFSLRHSSQEMMDEVEKLPESVRNRVVMLFEGEGPVQGW